jgi:SAM-dependent methyltransferase
MKVFDAYSKYYDLLYKDKDYYSEAEYAEKFIRKYKPSSKTILDLGSGTGRHDVVFAKKGYEVTGVERSPHMIEIANNNLIFQELTPADLQFVSGDIKEIRLNKKFDVVISLFHVMSYQIKNEEIKKTLETVKVHLEPDGIFIFDFWYGPGVLNMRPESRIKKLENKDILVERFAEPEMRVNQNTVDVNYKVKVNEKSNGEVCQIEETHSMRYFFLPELIFFLEESGMSPVDFEEWMTSAQLGENSWSALAVAVNKIK